jgi:hypothetical protein
MKKSYLINIDASREDLRGDFYEAHEGSWKKYMNPTDAELEESVKSEMKSWLGDLGIGIDFETDGTYFVLNGYQAVNLLDALQEWHEVVSPKELKFDEVGLNSDRYEEIVSLLGGE